MAIAANSVWEVRTTATAGNVNGGFYKTGASGTDFSQQDAAQYNLTGVTTAGADAILLTASAAADMVGNGAHIISGTNFTAGWYEILSVSVGVSITLDRTCTTGAGDIGVVNIGGAISLGAADDDAVFENAVAGNIFYIKGGTYTLGGAVSIAAAGSISGAASSYIRMEGYASARGDRPTGSTRPTINTAANNFVISGAAWEVRNIQFTGTSAIMFNYSGNVGRMIECKFTNTSTTASRIAVQLAANSHVNECEMISYRGTAFNANGEAQMFGCYVHDSNIGATLPSTTGGSHIINCIFAANVTSCVHVNAVSTLNNTIMNNIFFGGSTNKTGIGLNSSAATTYCMWVVNNIFYGFVTGVTTATTVGNSMINYDNYNCFAFNTTNATNWTLGPNSITTTPTFANVSQVTGATATTSGSVLTQAGATFVTSGVTAGRDFIYIVSGTGITAGVYGITNVAETALTLDIAPGTSAVADKVFQITVGRDFSVTSANVKSTGYPGVFAGGYTTSYQDIGAAQSQYGLGAAAGSGSFPTYTL